MKRLLYLCVISFALMVFGSVSEVSAVPIGTVSPSKTVTKINQKNKIRVIYNTADVSSVGVLVTDRKLSSNRTPADFIAYFLYDKTGDRLYMQEPLTGRLIGGYPPDSPNSIQYGDWRLNCDGTYTKSSGSALDMMWSITAITNRSYNGYIYISLTDRRGSFSGWELAGKMVVDNEPPAGTVVINGNSAATNNVNVTLTLNANDIHTSVAQMQFSNDGRTWTPAETYRSTKAWQLPAGDGQKTVYAKFCDTMGNWSGAVRDGIFLYTQGPVIILPVAAVGEVYQGAGSFGMVYDTELGIDVMELRSQSGLGFGITYPGRAEGSLNISKWLLSLNVKTTQPFRVTAHITADDGQDYNIIYTPENKIRVTKIQQNIYCPILPGFTDGRWHPVDLCMDASLYTMTGRHVRTVNRVDINGNLRVDDVRLRDIVPIEPIGMDQLNFQDGVTIPHFYINIGYTIGGGGWEPWTYTRWNGS